MKECRPHKGQPGAGLYLAGLVGVFNWASAFSERVAANAVLR
jgi:hypothetical protein